MNISLFAVAGSDSAILPVKKLRLQKRLLEDSGWIKAKVTGTGTTGSLGIRQDGNYMNTVKRILIHQVKMHQKVKVKEKSQITTR